MALTSGQKEQLRDLTRDISPDDLKEVFDFLRSRSNQLRQRQQSDASKNFMVGETVSFKTKRGLREKGEITTMNGMTAKVKVFKDQREWSVSYSLLRKE